jgi:hypothetical protein
MSVARVIMCVSCLSSFDSARVTFPLSLRWC